MFRCTSREKRSVCMSSQSLSGTLSRSDSYRVNTKNDQHDMTVKVPFIYSYIDFIRVKTHIKVIVWL